MATFDDPVGPELDEHGTASRLGAVIVQFMEPVGVGEPVGPETVAVNTRVPPVDTLLLLTETVGRFPTMMLPLDAVNDPSLAAIVYVPWYVDGAIREGVDAVVLDP